MPTPPRESIEGKNLKPHQQKAFEDMNTMYNQLLDMSKFKDSDEFKNDLTDDEIKDFDDQLDLMNKSYESLLKRVNKY